MKLIEKENVERCFGFAGINAIVESKKNGRLLIVDAFGGIDSMEGGSVRFKHGVVAKLKNDDTLEKLKIDWNECTSLMSAICAGYDPERQLLEWDGFAIQKMAEALELK